MSLLSDVLQDVKDELHHDGLVAPLAPPAVYDWDQHAVQGVQVLSREGKPVAPSHKSHLESQKKPAISFTLAAPRSFGYNLYL